MTTNTFLKYRNIWMGAAMIWIIWYHTMMIPVFPPLRYLNMLGYGGVDLFLFASGIGCFLSLQKDPDPFRFLKRRITKLFPTYLCFMVFWLAAMAIFAPMPATAAIGNLLGIQTFTGLGHGFNWYISGLLLMYVLTPVFHSMILQIRSASGHIAVIGLLLLLSVPFWGSGHLIIAVVRVPVYYVGMVFGSLCHSRQTLSKPLLTGSLVWTVVGFAGILCAVKLLNPYLWTCGLNWYPFLLITPGLCIAISWTMERLERFAPGRFLRSILAFFGKYSFEFYLVHILVFYIKDQLLNAQIIPDTFPGIWPITFVLVFAGVFLLRLLTQGVNRLLCRCSDIRKDAAA